MDKLLTGRGIPHEAHIYPGGHDWPYVLEHFAASLKRIRKALAQMRQSRTKYEA